MDSSVAVLAAGLLVFVSAAVQHANTVTANGLAFVFTDRAQPTSREGFPGRAERTLRNNIESFAMVAPPALLLALSGQGGGLAGLLTIAYVGLRIGFTLSYWAGIHRARSAFWGFGMGAIAVFYGLAAWDLSGFGN